MDVSSILVASRREIERCRKEKEVEGGKGIGVEIWTGC